MPLKKDHPTEKTRLHPRNKHRERYDFPLLIEACPELAPFVSLNRFGDVSIDFFDPTAVKMLNKALLQHYYGIENWTIPADYLCPPIPGRADYLHHIADVLCTKNFGKIPLGKEISVLDIGIGANGVYPLIGTNVYNWSFVGSDIDPIAMESVRGILKSNPHLIDCIELRFQENPGNIFRGIIQKEERFDVTICNPPFHASQQIAEAGTRRKIANLTGQKKEVPLLNFGGQHNELWCEGGEIAFVSNIARQSKEFANSCFWFSTLLSKESNIKSLNAILVRLGATEIKVIPMGQGTKSSRIVVWTFLTVETQKDWVKNRWRKVN
jgi:23S rRNA (adenine1618-N6)-methyltransferase